MGKIKIVVMFVMALAIACGCDDSLENSIQLYSVEMQIDLPEDVQGVALSNERYEFKNVSTGRAATFSSAEDIKVTVGLYDVTFTAEAEMPNGTVSTVKAFTQSVQVTGNNVVVELKAYSSMESDDLVIAEVFFTGTLQSSGNQYLGDGYVKLYNNTDHVLYADGLAFVESKFRSTQSYKFSPDLKNQAMTVHAVYVIPGSGTDHPVLPGQSLTICDTAIDHRVSNENSFNLSDADFEWYDESTVPSQTDIDNPEVPNMDKWYCDTKSIFILHNQGFTSFALARIPVSKQEFLTDYYYTYNYTLYLPSGTFPMSGDGFKIPNQWIVDGVNCSVESDRKWNVLPAAIDAGWTWCGRMSSDSDRFFKSVRRKMLYLTADGRRVLKDSNNSSLDFNPACTPSIIEVQRSAVNASGEKASTITYDGVQIIK